MFMELHIRTLVTTTPISKEANPSKTHESAHILGVRGINLNHTVELEQETAIHGQDVYSVDGREWIRCVGGARTYNDSRRDTELI